MHYLGKISAMIASSNCNFIYVLGDYNAHIDCCKNQMFGNELLTFCSDEGLVLSDVGFLGKNNNQSNTFTFVCELHHSMPWLDHCISNVEGHDEIISMEIMYSCTGSDHFPLSM